MKAEQQFYENLEIKAKTFVCEVCKLRKLVQTSGGTGYATTDTGKVCYTCCGKLEKKSMLETGKAILYLVLDMPFSKEKPNLAQSTNFGNGKVTNWPNSLSFPCRVKRGSHNWARTRYDVWFKVEGQNWHGVQYGDFTQLCHCRRIK